MLTVYLGLSLLFLILCFLSLRFPAGSPHEHRARRFMAIFLGVQSAWYLAFYATLATSGENRLYPTLQDGLGFLSYTLTVPMFHAFANRATPSYNWWIMAGTLILAVPVTVAVPSYIDKLHIGNLATIAIMAVNIKAIGTYMRVTNNVAASILWYLVLLFASLLCLRSLALFVDPGVAVWNESFLSFLLPLMSLSVTILILASVGLTAQQSLIRLALRDQLTGLRNRHALMEDYQSFISRLSRSGNAFALLVCDIDHFKLVNDKYTHEAGDKVLKAFAQRLNRVLREEDIAARVGGEEFVLLVSDASPQILARICERLLEEVRSMAFPDISPDLVITTSIGAVLVDDENIKFESAFRAADEQLYAVKAGGRDAFALSRSQIENSQG
ncbi:GGDEF domain-containing protein [Halioglobus maricola]|nr:GGDEF domain-containing protein [Halioglobus maricola]